METWETHKIMEIRNNSENSFFFAAYRGQFYLEQTIEPLKQIPLAVTKTSPKATHYRRKQSRGAIKALKNTGTIGS